MNFKPTSEEKLWAVISHFSAFLAGMGMLMPSFVWAEQRKKSQYATFQALQAFGYQSLGYTLWTLVALVVILIFTIATLPMLRNGESINSFVISHIVVTLVLYALYLLLPISGAVMCALGRDFRYPLLGARLANMTGYAPTADADEMDTISQERFAAAMAHFAVIYPLWGMLPSLIFLSLPGGRSRYMNFHSLQTIIFQGISTLVTYLLAFLTFLSMALIATTIVMPYLQDPNLYQPTPESFLPVFLFLILLLLFLLIVPLYQIIGQWAGLRLLQGHEYRYAMIGRWVERWLAKREQVE